MPNTTNFNWATPADTDLVKDGAAAIRTLGNSIDSSFVDLKGGTTGQVLTKASNTDLDFTFSSVDPLVILDAKGDLISATAADTPARLAVGANDTVLTADSSTSTGLKWAASAAPTYTWTSFTPTYGGGITIGNGTNTGKYLKIGKFVTIEVKFVLGSTSAVTGDVYIDTIPGSTINFTTQAVAYILDSGTTNYVGFVWATPGATDFTLRVLNSGSTYLGFTPLTSTIPMTWATGDEIRIFISYEEA